MSALHVAQVVPVTEAEGPAKRFAVWLQGCPLRCPGCCNPEMLPFTGGEEVDVSTLLAGVHEARRQGIEGVTLLGGEPFAQPGPAAEFAEQVRELSLSVMIFSGFSLAALRASPDVAVTRLLEHTDILVDGPFLKELPETRRRWIGSSNQRVHFLTDRCDPSDPRWQAPNTLEIRLVDGELTLNGFPAKQAVGLWKRLAR